MTENELAAIIAEQMKTMHADIGKYVDMLFGEDTGDGIGLEESIIRLELTYMVSKVILAQTAKESGVRNAEEVIGGASTLVQRLIGLSVLRNDHDILAKLFPNHAPYWRNAINEQEVKKAEEAADLLSEVLSNNPI